MAVPRILDTTPLPPGPTPFRKLGLLQQTVHRFAKLIARKRVGMLHAYHRHAPRWGVYNSAHSECEKSFRFGAFSFIWTKKSHFKVALEVAFDR